MKTITMKTLEGYWNSYRQSFDQDTDEILSCVLFEACSLTIDNYAKLEATYTYSRFNMSKIVRQYFYDMEQLYHNQIVHGYFPINRNVFIDQNKNISIVFSHPNFYITFHLS